MLEKEKEVMGKYNLEIVKTYTLINNDGIIFKLNNKEYDARHLRNIYGAEVDYYEITPLNEYKPTEEEKKTLEAIKEDLNKA